VGFFCDGGQAELELRSRLNHSASLVSDVLQRGRDVDLLGALVHPVENHVEEDIGPGPAHSITAVYNDGTGSPAV